MIFFLICFYFGKIVMFVPLSLLWPTKIVGRKNMPRNKSLIVVANHLSWVDILILWARIPGFRRFVAKKQVGKFGFKVFVAAAGTIFLDREGNDIKAIKRSIALLKKGQGLNIFPEGTRNKISTEIQPFKKGLAMMAIKANATVVPVCIQDRARIFRRNRVVVGEPIGFEQYNCKSDRVNMEEATETIYQAMLALKDSA